MAFMIPGIGPLIGIAIAGAAIASGVSTAMDKGCIPGGSS